MGEKEAKQIFNELKKYEELAAACNRCGFCTSYCPTYNATGSEAHSPRGRNQAFRAILEGRLQDPLSAKEIFDTCILCGECTSVCFSEVPTAQLMVQIRHYLNEKSTLPKGLTFVLDRLLPFPGLLSWVLKISFLGKKLGFATLFQKLGLLERYAPPLAVAERLVDDVPLQFFLEKRLTKPYQEKTFRKKENQVLVAKQKVSFLQSKKRKVHPGLLRLANTPVHRPKIALMPVCGSQYLRPSIGIATVKLFKRLKIDFVIPDAVCCGLPAASYGALGSVRNLASDNKLHLERGKYDAIVADDSSCVAHLKDYPRYFQSDQLSFQRSHSISQRVRELSSFLIQNGLLEHLKKVTWSGGPVAYHDPCKAQYAQKVADPPRELLGAIRALKLVPIRDADQCCGGGGTYSFVHPEMSEEITRKKISNVIASGCGTVVTSSSSCLIQLVHGLRKEKIEVLHLSEFLAKALGEKIQGD